MYEQHRDKDGTNYTTMMYQLNFKTKKKMVTIFFKSSGIENRNVLGTQKTVTVK